MALYAWWRGRDAPGADLAESASPGMSLVVPVMVRLDLTIHQEVYKVLWTCDEGWDSWDWPVS